MTFNPKKNQETDSSQHLLHYYLNVKIKDIEINAQNITVLQLREWAFDTVPRLEMIFLDQGIMFDKFPLEENDIINIELAVTKDETPVVNAKFNVLDFNVTPFITGENIGGSAVHVTAVLENKELFAPKKTRSFREVISSSVIEEIAAEIGYKANVLSETNDTMTWIQSHQNNNEMIGHLLARMYKNDNNCYFCATNRDSEMIIVTLQDALAEKPKFSAVFEIRQSSKLDEKTELDDYKITDDSELIYYSNYKYVNMGGTINKEIGYGQFLDYYNGEEFLVAESISDIHPLTTGSNKLKDLVGTEAGHVSKGMQSVNMHTNFMKAFSDNKYIKSEFCSSFLKLTSRPNANVKLFDKVDVVIPAQDNQFIDGTHSGEYMVGGIIHNVANKGLYTTDIYLFRNGKNINMGYDEKAESNLS